VNSAKRKKMNIPMNKVLYSRSNCSKMAEEILESGKIEGMTKSQLACEIFAHAYVFYNFRFIPSALGKTAKFRSFYRSVSDGVDLADNGDSMIRRIAYRVIWIMPAFAV